MQEGWGQLKLTFAFVVLVLLTLCAATLTCKRGEPSIPKTRVELDDGGRPVVIYTYYIDSRGREVIHGEKHLWNHTLGIYLVEWYADGEQFGTEYRTTYSYPR